jgi:Spy/CpxP family protein refolding chaperone
MRAPATLIAFATVSLIVVNMAGGQPPPGGGFGKGKGGNDYFSLANNGRIRAELKLTNEQAAKLPAAALKALSEVLDAGQFKRLHQIYLQQKGNSVFLDKEVKAELKITDEQAQKIKAALETQVKEQAEMFEAGGFNPEKMQEIQKTAAAAVQSVLTEPQKSAWTKMIGEPFQMKGGFGKGGFGKKKD